MDNQSMQLVLSIFDQTILVNVESARLLSILKKIYGSMQAINSDLQANLEYTITKNKEHQLSWITISRDGIDDLRTNDIGEFIFLFEKDMTIELQKLRSDLLFIHSAALDFEGNGLLLVAPSGTGKSTTAWALINSGFTYLSDELAPIDVKSMSIYPYHHALCLKSKPPIFELPDNTLYTSQTIHIPCDGLKIAQLTSLKAIFFLDFDATLKEAEITSISTAEAVGNLYSNSLNILAHGADDNGLNIAVNVAKYTQNYRLRSNDLEKTCKAVKLIMQDLHG